MPGQLTERARDFLEQRFARDAQGGYFPHQPVYGLSGPSEAGQLLRLARTYRLARWIEALKPASLLDLGAGEGYIANLLRLLCGCRTLCVDLSHEACKRAAEVYGQPGLACSLHSLPLRDQCADVVLLSEVFEHLEHPLDALSEALRVCRRFLVFTTQELCASRLEQRLRLALRAPDEPHTELNQLCRADLARLFKAPCSMEPQFKRSRRRLLTDVRREHWPEHLKWLANPRGWRATEGVLFVISVSGEPLPPLPDGADQNLWDALIEGPRRAAPQEPPWDWLDAVARPAGEELTLAVGASRPAQSALHPLIDPASAARLARLLAPPGAALARPGHRVFAAALQTMERIGYLTCGDPLAVKLRWLLRRPLAQ